MKMIILAAGQGTRLRPLTDHQPKCMVDYKGRPIIDYILEVAKKTNIQEIAVVGGYCNEVLQHYLQHSNIKFYTNPSYEKTNMVHTLFCAREFMDDDLIISYADIVYSKEILQKLIDSPHDFSVVVDQKWRELWCQRMDNPLDDAETLKIREGRIIELGKKPKNYSEVQGQYIGLIKISKAALSRVVNYYEHLDPSQSYDGQDFNNMYMTSFIQHMIDNLLEVSPVMIEGGWIEIDTISDLNIQIVEVAL